MLPVYGTQESDIRTPIKQKKRKEEKYEFKITNDEK